MKLILNEQQEKAVKMVKEWYTTRGGKQCFALVGAAGSGKTTIAKHIVYDVLDIDRDDVAFVAPTGKAATVLASKGCYGARTIHKLIYNCIEFTEKIKLGDKTLTIKRKKFVKKTVLPFNLKLIVCDEVSMISNQMVAELASFGIRILLLGDSFQLPPVSSVMNRYITEPDIELTQIMRQKDGNSILDVATTVRTGGELETKKYGKNVLILDRRYTSQDIIDRCLLKADQILCGRNKTQSELNKRVRFLKGYNTPSNQNKLPLKGERVICLNNSWTTYLDKKCDFALVNGTTGMVSQDIVTLNESKNIIGLHIISDTTDEESDYILADSSFFKDPTQEYERRNAYLLPDNKAILAQFDRNGKPKGELLDYIDKVNTSLDEKQVNAFDFGYAINVHRAQGSEYRNVVLYDESYCFKGSEARWLYTGITRAQNSLIIIR